HQPSHASAMSPTPPATPSTSPLSLHGRSSDLDGADAAGVDDVGNGVVAANVEDGDASCTEGIEVDGGGAGECVVDADAESGAAGDRKSTRLNSSHQIISYAVVCLQKNIRHAAM